MKLLLVDGHAYAYRAFFAIRELRAPDGRATNAIFGFTKMLARMQGLIQPSHLAVVWDGGLSAERVRLVPEYKAQRPDMPDELAAQIGEIMAYLAAAGILSCQRNGVEADDWIAGLARAASDAGGSVVIASSDKDFFQLVSPAIGLLNPADKSETIWTEQQVIEKTGVRPAQIVDWLSLVGDAVDNIPGVPGVGPKTAAELLRQFGSVDAIYQRLAEVRSDRLRGLLAAAEPEVHRNQEMIRLRDDHTDSCTLAELVPAAPDQSRLLEMARSWGFKGMVAELEKARDRQGQLFPVVS